jgi:RNA polymerase sigma-70 factor (ECF subfamily)
MQNRIVHDNELMVRLQRGDEWVFQLLVRRFREKVFSTAYGLTLDVQESLIIFKEVFQDIYDGSSSIDGDFSLNELIHRITVQRCLYRKRGWLGLLNKREESETEANHPSDDDAVSSSKDSFDGSQRFQIERSIKNLPELARAIYVLRESQRLSYEEIGKVLGMRTAAVRTQMRKARQKLLTLLPPVVIPVNEA